MDQEPCALTVSFISRLAMRRVNCRYRGRDYPTDVLSFGYGGVSDEGLPYLGDILIAVDVACAHAGRLKTPPDKEIRRLLVHGVLHLLGYDHETDSGEMAQIQARLIRRRYFGEGGPVLRLRGSPGSIAGKGETGC